MRVGLIRVPEPELVRHVREARQEAPLELHIDHDIIVAEPSKRLRPPLLRGLAPTHRPVKHVRLEEPEVPTLLRRHRIKKPGGK